MNAQIRPVLVAMAGAVLLTAGALVWLGRDLLQNRDQGSAPSPLLDLLEDGRRPSPGRRARRAPVPPRISTWQQPQSRRCPALDPDLSQRLQTLLASLPSYVERVRIHPTNYGHRYAQDAYGNALDPTPRVVVLHETVYGIDSAINTFITPHPRDEDQVSYHTLIGQNGRIVQLVDPAYRAYGAGNSAFNGQWVITNPKVGGSINNFALHLSLETPPDGENTAAEHSGYTPEQYDAMAVVLTDWMRRFNIPPNQITTHQHVDLAGERSDPRSFDWMELRARLAALGVIC